MIRVRVRVRSRVGPRSRVRFRSRVRVRARVRVRVSLLQCLSEVGVEGAHVADEGAREGHVAREPLDLVGEGLRLLAPALALAREAADEPVGRVHLLHARVGVVLQRLVRVRARGLG